MGSLFDLLGASTGGTVTVPGPPVQVAPGIATQPSFPTPPREGIPTAFLLGVPSGSPSPTPTVVWAIDGTTVSTALAPPTPPAGSVGKPLSMAVTYTNGVGSPATATVTATILAAYVTAPAAGPVASGRPTIAIDGGAAFADGAVLNLTRPAFTGGKAPLTHSQRLTDQAGVAMTTAATLTVDAGVRGKLALVLESWATDADGVQSATVYSLPFPVPQVATAAVQIVTDTAAYDAPGLRILLTQAELDAFNATPPAGHASDAILYLGA